MRLLRGGNKNELLERYTMVFDILNLGLEVDVGEVGRDNKYES
jgi:hypothetical protein